MKQLMRLSVLMWLAGCILLISGCATFTSTPSTEPVPVARDPAHQWQTYQQRLLAMKQWQAQGVIGIKANNKGDSANFTWKQDKQHFYIELYGPMGVGSTVLKGNHHQVTLIDSDGKRTTADSAEALMQRQLGWKLPLEGLYYWGRGVVDPASTGITHRNNQALLERLQQNGWDIRYKDYQLYEGRYPLPGRIIARHHNLTVTIVIHSWHLQD